MSTISLKERQISPPAFVQILITILLMGLLWFSASLAAYRVFTHGADHRDFYPLWAGARLLLDGNRDFYSEEATELIQLELYGERLPADRDQQGFAYPAFLAVVLLPFALILDVEVATAVFQGFSVLLFVSTLYVFRRDHTGGYSFWLVALLLWQFTVLVIFQGQVTMLLLAALGLGWALFDRQRDGAAGAVLALALVKPQLTVIPVLILLILAMRARRWRVWYGFAAGALVLLAGSLLLAGWWIPGWIDTLGRYAGYAKVFWPVGGLWAIHPLIAILLVGGIVFCVARVRREAGLLLATGVASGLLLLPQTLMWDLTLLTLPLALIWQGKTRWFGVAIWLLGWLSLLFSGTPDWWKIQEVLFPVLALGGICLVKKR